MHGREQTARGLRVVANGNLIVGEFTNHRDMLLHMLAVARVAASTNATLECGNDPGVHRQLRVVENEDRIGPLGHLPRMPEQPEAGDVGDGMHRTAMRLQRFARAAVETPHTRNRLGLVGIATAGERNGCAEWLGDHEHITGESAFLSEDAIWVHKTLHRKTKNGLGIANGVATCDCAASLGHYGGSSIEDRDDGFTREVFGERSNVDCDGDTPAHREHVATRVGRGDRTEIRRMIDEWREEVGGADHREIVGDLVHRGIIKWGETDDQRWIRRGWKVTHQARQQRCPPLGGASAARCPLGKSHTVEICHGAQPTVRAMISIGPYVFTETDALRTLGNLDALWSSMMEGRESARADAIGADLAARIATALGATHGASLAEVSTLAATSLAGSALLGEVLDDAWTSLAAATQVLRSDGQLPATASGVVSQLSASKGGVPKRALDEVHVSFTGVDGDAQGTRQHHGRPWQALCLYADEVIDAFRADGHPIGRGSAGENITVSGVPWSDVRPGVRLRIGTVIADVQAYAVPCRDNAQWFSDGDFNRMSSLRGPVSRVYATVREPGRIVTGDAIILEP